MDTYMSHVPAYRMLEATANTRNAEFSSPCQSLKIARLRQNLPSIGQNPDFQNSIRRLLPGNMETLSVPDNG